MIEKKENHSLKMKTNVFVFFLVMAGAIIVFDQLSKRLALDYFAAYPVPLFKDKIFLSFYLNDGLAFSLPAPFWLTLLVLPVGLFLLIRYYQKQPKQLPFFSFVLLFTGGVSNLIDRFVYGKVIDFIEISGVSVFNLADIMIVCGAIFLLIEELAFGFNKEK